MASLFDEASPPPVRWPLLLCPSRRETSTRWRPRHLAGRPADQNAQQCHPVRLDEPKLHRLALCGWCHHDPDQLQPLCARRTRGEATARGDAPAAISLRRCRRSPVPAPDWKPRTASTWTGTPPDTGNCKTPTKATKAGATPARRGGRRAPRARSARSCPSRIRDARAHPRRGAAPCCTRRGPQAWS